MKKLQHYYNKTFLLGASLIFASIVANGLNFLYNAYLGRVLDIESFGVLSLIGGILSISDIPLTALSRTVSYKSAFIYGKYQKTITLFWQKVRKKAFITAVFVTLAWIIAIPGLERFFDLETVMPFIIFTPIWIITIALAVDTGYLNGNLKFSVIALITVIEALVKLLVAILLVQVGLERYVYLAIPISLSFSLLIATIGIKRLRHVVKHIGNNEMVSFPKKFYATSLLTKLSAVAYLSCDLILAKHYLAPKEAGTYALLSLTGKMIFLAGALFAQFITPLIAKEEGAGRNSQKIMYRLLLAETIVCGIGFVCIGMFGWITVPYLLGHKAYAIVSYLPLYTLAMVFFTLANSIVTYHQVRKQYIFPLLSVFLAILQIIGIIISHANIQMITNIMVFIGFLYLLVMVILHIFLNRVIFIQKNIADFFGLFKPIPDVAVKRKSALRILLLNWRDNRHVWAGGAEVYMHEIAKQWVLEGNTVTVFCGNDGKSPRYEVIDGVSHVRRGGFYTVYFWAFLYYLIKFRNRFDVIVDSENGIPFFSTLYSRVPVFLLIHHIHQEVFRDHLRWPFSTIARLIEGKIMPVAYRNAKIITISDSSRDEICKIGLGKKEDIAIVHPGINYTSFVLEHKTKYPSISYLGRLKAYKNVDILIKSFAQICSKYPAAQLFIIGDGECKNMLLDLVKKLRISSNVRFFGKVSEEKKHILLSQSWLMVQPSQIEGWGITVIEANACKTPVIASNVNGLRDSVINGKTGLLVQPKSVKALAQTIDLLFSRPTYLRMLSKEAYLWAKSFSWQGSAGIFYQEINTYVKQKRTFRRQRQLAVSISH